MTFAELIKQARKAKHWSQADLARALGLSRNAVTEWEQGKSAPKRTRWPSVERALDLAAGTISPFTVSGITIVDAAEDKVVNLPLYKMSAISMRTGGELKFGVSDGTISVNTAYGASCFAARVADEAMAPLYQPGDVIIVDKSLSAEVHDGDDVVAGTPNDVLMLRQYKARGRNSHGREVYELRSTNADYPTIPMDSVEGMQIVGVVIEHRRRRRSS